MQQSSGIPPVITDKVVGKNVKIDISQDGFVLYVNMDGKPVGVSKSGKSVMLADTGGPVYIEGYHGLRINFSMYREIKTDD